MTQPSLKALETIAKTVSSFPASFPSHIRNKILFNTHQANEIIQFGMTNPQYLPSHLVSKSLYKHPTPFPPSSPTITSLSTNTSFHLQHYNNKDQVEFLHKLHDTNQLITLLVNNVFSTLQHSITKCPNKDTNFQKLFRPSDFLANKDSLINKHPQQLQVNVK